jgi:uncharacterized coiled-coil protein SlyX
MLRRALFCAAILGLSSGCATARPPIETQAALGKVVVYRNGVAYFERTAVVQDGKLKLRVPVDRVDDFLKSLRVVDAQTGKSLPVSFPTMTAGEHEADMVVSVPGKGTRMVRVTYVTDSPSWKPSYRLTLDQEKGRAELEAWAVVDNVSGEDWRQVTVGVGTTSALSFRYDLHSVRLVARETLSDTAAAALAPPTGGSPYAVASAELPVVASLDGSLVERLLAAPEAVPSPEAPAGLGRVGQGAGGAGMGRGESRDEARRRLAARTSKAARLDMAPSDPGAAVAVRPTVASAPRSDKKADGALDRLVRQVHEQSGRVRIEGFARSDDADRESAALARASALRDRLVAHGVSPDKVEATANGIVNDAQAVRLVAAGPSEVSAEQPKGEGGARDPGGSAYFVAGGPMTIEKNHSAMVSLLKQSVTAERVYYYDPVSDRGSREFAFQAVRIDNPTEHTLDRGPFTVYAKGQFLGEGLSDPIPPRSTAFVPFALDRQLVVEPKIEGREEIQNLVTIERGVVTAEVQQIRKTLLSLHNRGDAPATVFVRHAVAPGWDLVPSKLHVERLAGTHLFRIEVPAKTASSLAVEESQPIRKTVDLRTTRGAQAVGVYLKGATGLSPALREQLTQVLALHREMADVEQRIETLEAQMREYRARVNELNVQLVTLRNVRTARDLSRHLAKKMEEVSERLQKITISVTDLREDLMTRRIRIQDAIADLTLADAPERAVKVSPPTGGTQPARSES